MTKPLMTRILLATDFSDGAACAQDYAIYLASHWGATLEVLHVIETPHRSSAEAESLAAVVQVRAEAARQLEQFGCPCTGSGVVPDHAFLWRVRNPDGGGHAVFRYHTDDPVCAEPAAAQRPASAFSPSRPLMKGTHPWHLRKPG